MPTKRKRAVAGDVHVVEQRTPTKRALVADSSVQESPSKAPSISNGLSHKTAALALEASTLATANGADRSARRKSTQKLLERTVGELSDDEDAGEDELAAQIYDEAGESNGSDPEEGADGEDPILHDGKTMEEILNEPIFLDTPSKRGRGRPKGSRNRSLTPPVSNAPPHELYFHQNRASALKVVSTNTFPAEAVISHAVYHEAISAYKDNRHAEALENLYDIHEAQFPLWKFELQQGFSVLLYGYGRKKTLLTGFAGYLHACAKRHGVVTTSAQETSRSKGTSKRKAPSKTAAAIVGEEIDALSSPFTIVLNGHHPSLTPRSLFATIANACLSPDLSSALPLQASDACAYLLQHLPKPTSTTTLPHIYILLDCIHTSPLTRAPFPTLLAHLITHPRVSLIATADDVNVPLLWPLPLREKFNWVFHDGTTFVPYDSGDGTVGSQGVVDAVNELLGRKGASGKGREGIRWVLRSLPENARGVYRVLVAEILSLCEEGLDFGGGGMEENDEDEDDYMGGGDEPRRLVLRGKRRAPTGEMPAVGYKTLYAKAVEEFLCSSEMALRGLLKEFVDHQMVVSRRDGSGAEMLSVEMRKEELEGVLEDLMME